MKNHHKIIEKSNTSCYTKSITLTTDELRIEWDTRKDSINLKKHGVSFKEASAIFLDNNRIEIFDVIHSDIEHRFAVIGMVRDILLVIYTERWDSIRIISARKATKSERELYYGKNS